MVHGFPDWGVTAGKKTTYQLKDMAELAVRLGSIVNSDRLGDVVWMDDFEASTLKWETYGTGTGNAQALSTETAKNGSQSCKLTTGNAQYNEARITHYSPMPVLGNIGAEMSFAIGAEIYAIVLYLRVYDGAYRNQTVIWIDPQNNELKYMDKNGAYQVFATGVDLYENDLMFHTAKLVVDFSAGYYIRFRLNNATYDLSAFQIEKSTSAILPRMDCIISVYNNSAGNHYVYIDDVIFTQNEP